MANYPLSSIQNPYTYSLALKNQIIMTEFGKINLHAAGMDLGTEQIFVSTDGETVKAFGTFTSDLHDLKTYLIAEGVTTVMMEATGVLWVPIFDILESAGINVCLVNAAHAKNIPAQKSDPADCRWLYKLHVYGFVRASFIPDETIRELRIYIRQREDNKCIASSHIQHIQKAFELMNIKLHNVISDIMGVSGLSIIEAILAGEHDAEKLTALCNKQILKEKKEKVLQSLKGNFKREYIFMMQQAYDAWCFYQKQIENCDIKIGELLKKMTENLPKPPQEFLGKPKPSRHDDLNVDNLHDQLVCVNNGRNAASLPGFSDSAVLKLTAELGTDFSKWATDKHFTSWLGLSPRKYQSGKTNKTRRSLKKNTKAGQIFKELSMSIAGSKHLALKGFYNRIKSRSGSKAAIKAVARKLAKLYYDYMTRGFTYVEQGLNEYEKKYKTAMIKGLEKKAKNIGYQLIPIGVH